MLKLVQNVLTCFYEVNHAIVNASVGIFFSTSNTYSCISVQNTIILQYNKKIAKVQRFPYDYYAMFVNKVMADTHTHTVISTAASFSYFTFDPSCIQ